MIETLKARVNSDEALVRRGRFLTTTFLLEVGQIPWLISDFRRQGRVGDAGAVCDAIVVIFPARAGTGMGKILEQPAAPRLS